MSNAAAVAAESLMELEQEFGRRQVGPVNDEAPAEPFGLGADFGAGLSEREVDYLMREEWAQSADDVLWRRSKLGLRFSAAQTAALDDVMQRKAAAALAQDERRRA